MFQLVRLTITKYSQENQEGGVWVTIVSVVVEVEEFLSMDRDLILIKVIFEAEW